MRRFLKKILVLCLLMLAAAIVLDAAFTSIFREGRTVKAQWLRSIQGQHFDVVVTGSSRAWWNIDVNAIARACDLRAISLANNHFTPSEVLLSLKLFLANGNTVDRILYEVNYQSLSVEQDEFSSTVYDHLPWLEDTIVYGHLAYRSNEWIWLRHVPFARYARYNFRWGAEEALVTLLDERNTLFDSTGSFFIDRDYRGYPYYEVRPTTFRLNDDIRRTIRLCEERGIQLVLFMAPYYRLRMFEGGEEQLRNMLNEEGLVMHDFSMRLDSTIHFDNNYHLSLRGGRLFTDMLINELVCPEQMSKNMPASPVQ